MKPVITCTVHYEQQRCPSLPPPQRHPSSPSSRPGAVNTRAGVPHLILALQPSPPQMMSASQAPTEMHTNPPQDSNPRIQVLIYTSTPTSPLSSALLLSRAQPLNSHQTSPPNPTDPARSTPSPPAWGDSSPSSPSLWTRAQAPPHQPPRLAPGVCGSSQLPRQPSLPQIHANAYAARQ